MTIGEKIKTYRKKAGLTQKKLGELSGTSERTIQNYELEKRQPQLGQIRKIAAALGVYMSDLVGDWSTFSREEIAEDWKNGTSGGITHKEAIARGGYHVEESEKPLLDIYRQLNPAGQGKVVEQVELLTKIPEYRKD